MRMLSECLAAALEQLAKDLRAPRIDGVCREVAGDGEREDTPASGLRDGQSRPHVGTETDMRTRLPAEVALSEFPARNAGRRVGVFTHRRPRRVPALWLSNAGL
jgi:hypothetical protein